MSKLPRIREVQVLEAQRVRLVLTDGATIERDVGPYLSGPAFDGIRSDPARFAELRVEGGALVWPGGADLCPDVVIWGGPPPADADTRAA